jgi:hypothetical protein
MSSCRPIELDRFLDAARLAIESRAAPESPTGRANARIFSALARPGNLCSNRPAIRLPVCDHLAGAIGRARGGPDDIARIAGAFAALEPLAPWRRRPSEDAAFSEGHANIYFVGPDALELRSDVVIGASLLAPGITYPDHRHPPEEVYAVLSPGEWRQGSGPWHEPSVGGIVYNPPGIVHAMRAGDAPLLAVWCLWVEL